MLITTHALAALRRRRIALAQRDLARAQHAAAYHAARLARLSAEPTAYSAADIAADITRRVKREALA